MADNNTSNNSDNKPKRGRPPKPQVKIVLQRHAPPDNFPFSVETAKRDYTNWLQEELENGYRFYGTFKQATGDELLTFFVFYLA